jgi:hypothetical protein
MSRRSSILTTLLLAGALCTSVAYGGVIYDLRSDWSLVSNPNGVWSYNQGRSHGDFLGHYLEYDSAARMGESPESECLFRA